MAFGAIFNGDAGFHVILFALKLALKTPGKYLVLGMLTISGLFIYPIKSLGGIALEKSFLTDRGFQYDRRWMLVNPSGKFYTQRDNPEMALLKVELKAAGLEVYHSADPDDRIEIPFQFTPSGVLPVIVWEDTCEAQLVSDSIDAWFTRVLNMPCRLVFMPDQTHRPVDPDYATRQEITSFSDGYPVLVIGQASLDDLNAKLNVPVPMNRFRPNIVFEGGRPYQEDGMTAFQVNGINFSGVKLCGRCMVTTIDQDTAETGKDPLKTLATYRLINNKVMFGMNLLHDSSGWIAVGDSISLR